MTEKLSPRNLQCPYCNTPIPPSWAGEVCPVCGGPMDAISGPVRHGKEAVLQEQMMALNQQLIEAGSVNAEDAFSLGCWMGAILVLLAGTLSYFFLGKNWAIVAIVVVTITIALTGISAILSLRAKDNTMRRAYREAVAPEIATLAHIHGVSWSELKSITRSALAAEAPLRVYLAQESPPGLTS